MDRTGSNSHWRLTSLDFINRPNPIEPQSEPHKHPLNGAPRHPNGVNQDLRRLLLERDVASQDGGPSKRHKLGAAIDNEDLSGGSLDLPRLPVRNGTKRMRIPPTLSGLHQPPPDAGLLPSILVEQPPDTAARRRPAIEDSVNVAVATQDVVERGQTKSPPSEPRPSKTKRNRWTDDETACLLKGVARFNVGNWKKILECEDYRFNCRTALDLRDRFRVCRPQDYKDRGDEEFSSSNLDTMSAEKHNDDPPEGAIRDVKSGRKSTDYLRTLGIQEPFEKVKRRKRTKYSTTEDQALLEGFEKHGNVWAAILEDGKDRFQPFRTATDLRDRFRTKHPDRYAKIGLAPRPDTLSAPPQRMKDQPVQHARDSNSDQSLPIRAANLEAQGEQTVEEPRHIIPEKQQNSIFAYDDVFFGAPFNDDEPENNRVVLDRGILDWANDPPRTLPSEMGRAGIDPRAILRPPNAISSAANGPAMLAPASGAGEMLPPLAAITADMNDQGHHQYDQLELPSLMLGGSLDVGDGRGGSHLMNIEDMLG